MTLDVSTGQQGIGTVGPVEQLEVNGGVKIGDTAGANLGTMRWRDTRPSGGTVTEFQGYKPGGRTGSQWTTFNQPGCTTSGLTGGVVGWRTVNGTEYYVRRMADINDFFVVDYGSSGAFDDLNIYCVSTSSTAGELGQIAICLSNENCPWR